MNKLNIIRKTLNEIKIELIDELKKYKGLNFDTNRISVFDPMGESYKDEMFITSLTEDAIYLDEQCFDYMDINVSELVQILEQLN